MNMTSDEKEQYREKVHGEIDRVLSTGRTVLWADFNVNKEKKQIIEAHFAKTYDIEFEFCSSCSGYNIIINRK